jgi:hypothetical protein
MSDKNSMSFTLNQAALNAAIAAELPRLLRELNFEYTSGRAPKGLTAEVTVSESMIRQAVIAHARKTVNASFNHFAISFRATRGEDGIITSVTASSAPIEQSEAPKAEVVLESAVPAAEETEAPAEVAPVQAEQVEEVVAEASSEEEAADAGASAPARSKLFAGLTRPNNSASAE